MAHDPHATPLAVLRRYPREVWNDGGIDVLAEIVSDPCRRHDPGRFETVTNAELAERVRYFRRGLSQASFHRVLEGAAGPYVTTAWETTGYTGDGRHLCSAGAEVCGTGHGHTADGERAWTVLWDRTASDGGVVAVEGRVREWGSVPRGASGAA